jgi:hypothetical protein
MILDLDDLFCFSFTLAILMHGINPQSVKHKCIACGIEKSLKGDFFQVVRTFAKGYSFYCNVYNKEPKRLKCHPNSKATPVLVNNDKSLDLKPESPARINCFRLFESMGSEGDDGQSQLRLLAA